MNSERADSSSAELGAPAVGPSLRRLAERWPRSVVLAWLAIIVAAGVFAWPRAQVHDEIDALLPVSDRGARGFPRALLELVTLPDGPPPSKVALDDAALRIARQLGKERVPLTPPRSELEAWIEEHLLYLLPLQAHEQLARRLSPEALAQSVDRLHARLGSPMYGMASDVARRDPLELHALLDTRSMFRTLGIAGDARDPRATPLGDLVSADGTAVLIQLQSDRSSDALALELDAALEGLPVRATLVGSEARAEAARRSVGSHTRDILFGTLAGMTVVLALALRRVRPVFALMLGTSSGAVILFAIGGGVGLLSLPLLPLLLGFSAEGALHLQRLSRRGWAGPVVIASSLLPLWFSPYPVWRTWSVVWFVAFLATALALRLFMPALLHWTKGTMPVHRTGFHLTPLPWVALVTTVVMLLAGAWASSNLRYQEPQRLRLGDPNVAAARATLVAQFYDPGNTAYFDVRAPDAATALDVSAEQTAALRQHAWVRGIEGPGALLLPERVIGERRASLQRMGLDAKLQSFREQLESRGFRPDAFGEFLASGSALARPPRGDDAWRGPVGSWLRRFTTRDGDDMRVRTWVQLEPTADFDPSAFAPQLHGPAVAAMQDRAQFGDRAGVYTSVIVGIATVVVWIGSRSMAVALASALAGLLAQMALILFLWTVDLPWGPHLVPALLLVTAAGVMASARCCVAIEQGRPIAAHGLLLVSACQVVGGLVLVGRGEPAWTQFGVAIAVGAVMASGIGLFIAPGLAALVQRARGRATT